jgi:hypothetical protein
MKSKPIYGENTSGKMFKLNDRVIWVDDKFVLSTLIAVITTLEMTNPNISDAISSMAETIYEHIEETNTSELGETGTDAGIPTAGGESDGVA